MNITILGIDIAKNVFQLHGIDDKGNTVYKKRLSRDKLAETLAQLPRCLVAMEACASAHYWGRTFKRLGHSVKLLNARFVKPYLKTNKNDAHDAQAIAEAASRPHLHGIPVKTVEQHDMQSLHRIRSRLIQSRTALVNQIRGLLGEYGLAAPQGIHKLRKLLPEYLEEAENELSR